MESSDIKKYQAPPAPEDPEKKKRDEKAREKQLKKENFLQKQARQQQAANVSKKSEKKTVKRDAKDENPTDYIDPQTTLGDKKQMSRQLADFAF